MYIRNWEDFFIDEVRAVYSPAQVLDADLTINDGPPGSVTGGVLDSDDPEVFAVQLTAGVTYTFAQRPTVTNGIEDPLLSLYGPDSKLITFDDDGGAGRSSLLTYTPTVSGTYYLHADSWVNADSTGGDRGGFNLFQWDSTSPDTGATAATAFAITTGTTFGQLATSGDVDMYKIDVKAGMVYTFGFSGGYDGAGEPGVIANLQLYAANGTTLLASNLATESGTSYFAKTDTTLYVKLTPYTALAAGKGGYTLDVEAIDPATRDPLEAFIWDSADNVVPKEGDGNTVYIYFAPKGENLVAGETNLGWQQNQIDAVMHALNTAYTPLTGYNYVITQDSGEATFRMQTVTNNTYGARFYPQDAETYGDLAGVGSFNLASGGFGSDPNSLLPGGFSYAVILHEFGHAHGIAHPHDTGGGSEVMLGVTGSTGSLGVYDLNQGVYTVMSYNDGWPTHPDGVRSYSAANRAAGWSETLGAFDIAVMQARGYATQPTNTGDTVYTISDSQATSSYKTILDTSGIDTIAYSGSKNAQIDLGAATLDYSPTGGGMISFAHGIWGGYTIANGVVIENATGGSGNDVLIGNSANNVLTGNAGNDTLAGREGLDVYKTGAGADTIMVALDNAKVDAVRGPLAYDIVTDFDGVIDKLDFSELDADLSTAADDAFRWLGTSASKSAGDLSYRVYDSVNSAERALGIEIDDYSGKYTGKVTIVSANVDGGAVDYAVVLLGAPQLTAADFTL